ncbi:MAG: hypothetical protein SVV03_03295 [Candidatus Nanohaloarchaea archaeon]|nr:hypothetical protein [Candidatus Nanohaloarchaea archaeon]
MARFNIPIGKADIIIAIFIVGVGGAALLMSYGSTGSSDVPGYCTEWASAAETNLSRQYGNVSCECKPGEKYKDRIDTPQEVKERADLNFIDCNVGDRDILFPVWRINGSEVKDNRSARVVGKRY